MQKNNAGFTLIEILIALAILSIALTAVIYTTSRTIKDNAYLQTKTIATWVGTEVVNEIRAHVQIIAEDDEVEKETEMLGMTWPWTATLSRTNNNHIQKITVTVFSQDKENSVVHLESYLYVP